MPLTGTSGGASDDLAVWSSLLREIFTNMIITVSFIIMVARWWLSRGTSGLRSVASPPSHSERLILFPANRDAPSAASSEGHKITMECNKIQSLQKCILYLYYSHFVSGIPVERLSGLINVFPCILYLYFSLEVPTSAVF